MYKKTTAILENTNFEERIDDITGAIISYRIYPVGGYKLHEISLDEQIVDEVTLEETGEIKRGLTKSFVTTSPDYDFKSNPREIYAEKELQEDE